MKNFTFIFNFSVCNEVKYLGKFYLYRVLKLLQCVSSGLDKFRTNTGLTQYYVMKTPYVKNEHGEMSLL